MIYDICCICYTTSINSYQVQSCIILLRLTPFLFFFTVSLNSCDNFQIQIQIPKIFRKYRFGFVSLGFVVITTILVMHTFI